MPSPIAHSITGYALFKLFRLKGHLPLRLSPLLMGWSILAANAADLDFLPQLLTDFRTHRGLTHSLGFTLGFSLFATLVICLWARLQIKAAILPRRILLLMATIYGSHLLLDFFNSGGQGIQMLWPLTSDFFQSPLPLFPAVHHSRGLFDWSHLVFISYELLYAIILLKSIKLLSYKQPKTRPKAQLNLNK